MKTETMWAIYNNKYGFYRGTWFKKRDAISEHCSAYWDTSWKERKKHGDRAVRVRLVLVKKQGRTKC